MNTNGLAKHYNQLTPRERLPLIAAAQRRGDQRECQRLAASAPRVGFNIGNHHGLVEGLELSACCLMLECLNFAGHFLLVHWTADATELVPRGQKLGASQNRSQDIAGIFAYLLCVKWEAWQTFCAEMNVEGDFVVRDLPGFDLLSRVVEIARDMAATREQADAFVQRKEGPDARVWTADLVVKGMHEFVEFCSQQWS
jgi:hypothetical protein